MREFMNLLNVKWYMNLVECLQIFLPFSGNFDDYTGGFSEEEQMRQAVEESLRQRANRAPGAPPYPF